MALHYVDQLVPLAGFYGETLNASCGCTIVQKTHGYTVGPRRSAWTSWAERRRMVERHGGRALLIVRNPYEALLAFRNFAVGQLGHQTDSHFVGKGGSAARNRLARVEDY